jgi:hypothetical protein
MLSACLGFVALAVPGQAVPIPKLHGHLRYETFAYPDGDRLNQGWENFFEAVVRGRGRLSSVLTYRFEGRLVADDAQLTAGGFSLRNGEVRRPYFSITEAVVTYRPLPWLRVSAGKDLVNWSIMDGLQPANFMSAIDESDIFRTVDQGLYGFSVHVGTGSTYADLAVVPLIFTPARLPQGRWDIIPGDVLRRKDMPPVTFRETQAGLRLGARVQGVDVNLIGYVGRDWAAVFIPNVIFVGGPDRFKLEIIDRYARLRAGGFNVSAALGESLLLRTEMIYYSTPEEYRDEFFHTVFGIEYTRSDWRMNVAYMREDRTAKATQEVTDKGERRFFRNFLYGSINYDAGARLEGELGVSYDVTRRFLLTTWDVSYRVWRNLRAGIVGELITAWEDTYFDRIRHEDRIGTRLTYSF